MEEILIKLFNIYPVKKIYLGYITTINDINQKDPLDNKIAAFRRIIKNGVVSYEPLNSRYQYYSINKLVPLVNVVATKNKYISSEEIDKILKIKNSDKNEIEREINKLKEENLIKRQEKEKINYINNELDINKKLKKVI